MGRVYWRYGIYTRQCTLDCILSSLQTHRVTNLIPKIYIELGQAPENDPVLLRSSVELVASALPPINYTARFTTQFLHASLEINSDVLLCLSYLQLFNSKTGTVSHAFVYLQAKKTAILEGEGDVNTYNQVDNLLDNILVTKHNIQIPKLHLFRSMFFHLLADRCKWLRSYCACIRITLLYFFKVI